MSTLRVTGREAMLHPVVECLRLIVQQENAAHHAADQLQNILQSYLQNSIQIMEQTYLIGNMFQGLQLVALPDDMGLKVPLRGDIPPHLDDGFPAINSSPNASYRNQTNHVFP